jgi:hypothetical protein
MRITELLAWAAWMSELFWRPFFLRQPIPNPKVHATTSEPTLTVHTSSHAMAHMPRSQPAIALLAQLLQLTAQQMVHCRQAPVQARCPHQCSE